jgi:hypothetical protein
VSVCGGWCKVSSLEASCTAFWRRILCKKRPHRKHTTYPYIIETSPPKKNKKKTHFLPLSPLPLLPHRLMSYFYVWHHLSFRENPHRTQDSIAATRQQLNPPTWRKKKKVLAPTIVYWRGAERGDQFYRAISNMSILV